jgi:hypothetical protein
MTRAPSLREVRADVRELAGDHLRVTVRGRTADLFAPLQASRLLGARIGARLLVSTDVETVAGDITHVDGAAIELRLTASLIEKPETVTLRPSMTRNEPRKE